MEELQISQHVDQLIRRAVRAISRYEGRTVESFDWKDVRHRDMLAREIYHDTNASPDECAVLMRDLVQPSPGGMLALAWLSRIGQINGDALLNYVCGLIGGEPIPEALDVKDAVEVFERLTQIQPMSSQVRRAVSFYLLSTAYVSAKARVACLDRVMNLSAFIAEDRKIIYAWAMGLDVGLEIPNCDVPVPGVPAALARQAVASMVDLGWQSTEVIRHVISNIADWEDRRFVLNGVLDLIDRECPDLQASVRKQAFEVCLEHEDAALRRRVYRIATRTEPKDFLLKATKDPDASVRRWAVGMIKNR